MTWVAPIAMHQTPEEYGLGSQKKLRWQTRLLNLPGILFSTCYKGMVRFTRKVLLECVPFDNKLMKGKLILPCQKVLATFILPTS